MRGLSAFTNRLSVCGGQLTEVAELNFTTSF